MNEAGQDKLAGLAVRPALMAEVPTLENLITASARALSESFYSAGEIEAAIQHVFGVDTNLVRDGTYFVAESRGEVVGCGGWSRRRTLFGGDRFAVRDDGYLDPATDAAAVRAFFIAPRHARRGIAAQLLASCENAMVENGFSRSRLMATLPGAPFYAAHGYRGNAPITHLCGDTPVRFVPMHKQLLQK